MRKGSPGRSASGVGFSTNASTEPSGYRRTRPKALGSSTGVSTTVASAPVRRWATATASRSRSVRMSPLSTRNRVPSSSASAFLIAPGSAERLGVDDVAQPHAGRLPVAEVGAQRVGPVAAGEDDVRHAVAAQQVELVRHEGPVDQGHHRLGARVGEGPQAGARATDEDDGLHQAVMRGFGRCPRTCSPRRPWRRGPGRFARRSGPGSAWWTAAPPSRAPRSTPTRSPAPPRRRR